MALRRLTEEQAQVDVSLKGLHNDVGGLEIVNKVTSKGFCVVDSGFDKGIFETALNEIKQFDGLGRWQKLNRVVRDGLLGQEGSASIAELESPDLEDEVRSDGEMLMKLDNEITSIGFKMVPFLGALGFDVSHRTLAVVHQAGEPDEDPARLTEKQVMKWLAQFLRHRLMVLVFLGPTSGTLELQPYSTEDTALYEVPTPPGTIVVLRPDLMSHKHYAPGRALALSSFFLTGHLQKGTPAAGGYPMTPQARELDEWTVNRLRQLKEEEKDDGVWDPDIPRDWRHAMNHMYHKGQMIAVRGAACKFPGTTNPQDFWRSTISAPDFVTEVPLCRWDHSVVYDADPQSHKYYKSYSKHAAFMDNIEMFDPKIFSMTPNEAKSMDPHQRMIMEVGYECLFSMGMRKNTLTNSACGVYVGCGNTEWSAAEKAADFGAFGATGSAMSISSGRFSFSLGMKGPSLTLDTEGCSGATAIYLAAESCQKKGRAVANEFAIGIAAHILLTPIWWPSQCAAGWLCASGRCLTFDECADGYTRADGIAAASVKCLSQVIDGEVVSNESEPLVGNIAGAMMNNNGRSANLTAPYGPAEQEVIMEAIRNASISPFDVDAVEAHATGTLLADAVEADSLVRGMRSEEYRDPLPISAVKSSMGNQIETGSLTAFLRTLYSMQWGAVAPNLHLNIANPHMDAFEQPCSFATDCMEYKMQTSFVGSLSRGFGGTNCALLAWGQVCEEKVQSAPSPSLLENAIKFWPGGGGELEGEQRPTRTYTIAGTWSNWSECQTMESEGNGVFAFTMTLGENRWEQFQIWLDGDSTKVLHPGQPKAFRDTPVFGPGDDAEGCNWIIDGRSQFLTVDNNGTETPLETLEQGRPGDRYRIYLRIVGKWRTVSWQKLQTSSPPGQTTPSYSSGRYFLAASWNQWAMEEMLPDESRPGVFSKQVTVHNYGENFQIVRNLDWNQVLYPADLRGDSNSEVLGPDDIGVDLVWHIDTRPGETFVIEFQRQVDLDNDDKQVSWRRLDAVRAPDERET